MSVKTSLHCQGWETWTLDYLGVTGAPWIKFVNAFPILAGVKIIGRVHVPESEQDAWIAMGKDGAKPFFDRVRPEMEKARHVAIWEGPNEPSIWNPAVLNGLVPFYQELIRLYHASDFPIMAGQINTGWPYLPSDDGGAQSRIVGQAIQGADAVGLHEYDPLNLIDGEARKTMLRYRITTDYWRSIGLTVPPVFITEHGLARDGTANFGLDGWKTILQGNLAEYIRQLCWYESEIQKDDYVQAATIFSVITNWTDFALDQGQCMELAKELVKVEPPPPPPPPERARGIDVCTYQGDINWELVKADGFEFVMIRVSGPNDERTAVIVDPRFEANYAGAGSVGLLRGGYHGLVPVFEKQANLFVDTVNGRPLELGYWSDLENRALTDYKCGVHLEAVDRLVAEKLGLPSARSTGVYTSPGFMTGRDSSWAEGRKLWVAHWTYDSTLNPIVPAPWTEWEFWQWTNEGVDVPGVPKRTCLDVYAGTPEQLHSVYGNGGEETYMDVKVFDFEGNEKDWAWLVATYGAVNIQTPDASSYFKVVEIREKHDDSAFIARVLEADGSPKVGKTVLFYWPDAPAAPGSGWLEQGVGGVTNDNGEVGFGMGSGAWYAPPDGGPHKSWLFGDNVSEMVEGIGMLLGPDGPTNHDHLDITWQYVEGDDPEPPPPPPPPPPGSHRITGTFGGIPVDLLITPVEG